MLTGRSFRNVQLNPTETCGDLRYGVRYVRGHIGLLWTVYLGATYPVKAGMYSNLLGFIGRHKARRSGGVVG